MIKKYSFALANLVMLIWCGFFTWHKYTFIDQYYIELALDYNYDYGVIDILRVMKHDILLISASLLSFIGIVFCNKKIFFYYASTFFAAMQFVILILVPNFSFSYLTNLTSELIFLWFLLFGNIYSFYENRLKIKVVFFVVGIILYIPFLISWVNLK